MNKSVEDRAKEIVNNLPNFEDGYTGVIIDRGHEILIKIIAESFLAIQNETYEECAKFVENYLIYTGPGGFDPEPIQKKIAKAIRSKIGAKYE